jgi:hypothetical protein
MNRDAKVDAQIAFGLCGDCQREPGTEQHKCPLLADCALGANFCNCCAKCAARCSELAEGV